MRLVVELNRTGELGSQLKRYHPDTVNYRTMDGELDVFDEQGVIVTTYNARAWERVVREKDDDEEWPESVLTTDFIESQENIGGIGVSTGLPPSWMPGQDRTPAPPG